MIAGVDPDLTPLDQWLDAVWAVWAEYLGPGEHFAEAWTELTGETVDAKTGAITPAPVEPGSGGVIPLPQQHRGGDQDAVAAVRGLSDDELAKFVPAYRRALEAGDDAALEQLDRHWAYTAGFASGQDSLVKAFGDASKATTTRPDGSVAVAAPKPQPVFGEG